MAKETSINVNLQVIIKLIEQMKPQEIEYIAQEVDKILEDKKRIM